MRQRNVLAGALLFLGLVVAGAWILPDLRRERLPSAPRLEPSAAPAGAETSKEDGSSGQADEPPPHRSAPAGVIRGRVFLETPPAPAPGASVAALLDLARSYAAVAVSGPDGAYELSGLAPGRYRVIAWRGEWAMESLGPGEELVEVLAEPAEGVDRTLLPGGVLTGKVVEEGTKEPIAGAAIELSRLFTKTDGGGQFRLEGVRPGIHWILARAGGFTPVKELAQVTLGCKPDVLLEMRPGGLIEGLVTSSEGEPVPGASVWTDEGRARIETAADARGRYALEGVPLDARAIRVFAAVDGRFETVETLEGFPEGEASARLDLRLGAGVALAGQVVDVRGRPVPGAELYMECSWQKPSAVTGEDGLFTIVGAASLEGYLTARKKGCAPATQDLRSFYSSEERRAIEFVLEPGHSVEGKVVDAAGHPIHGAWVGIDSVGNDVGPYPFGYSARDGSFRLDGLAPGSCELAAAKAGYLESRGNRFEADTTGAVLVLEEAVIEGLVLDEDSGKPIPEFTVSIEWRELQARGGRFRIDADMERGKSYRLIVFAEGYAESIVNDVMPWSASEAREPLRIELERGGTLLGRVVSTETGAPVEGVRITHIAEPMETRESNWFERFSRRERVLRNATSDAAGEFQVAGLSARPGVLLLDKKGYARTVLARVKASGLPETFELAPGAVVEGTVRDLAGKPAPGIGVCAFASGQRFPPTRTGAGDKYRIEDLPEGAANVAFDMPWSEGRRPIRRQVAVTLKSGETVVADLVLETGSIAGTLAQNGVPVCGADVLLTRAEDGTGAYFLTDTKGRFHMGALPPGEYEVNVELVREGGVGRRIGHVRKIDVGTGETRCDIDLAATRVSGRVVRGKTGEPVRGAYVTLLDVDGRTRADAACPSTSDAFDLEAPGTGRYWLAASEAKGASTAGWLGPLAVEEGVGLGGLVLPLGGAGGISALVVDQTTGEALSGARVLLSDAAGIAFKASGATDAAGRVELSELMPGSYRLEAETQDHLALAVTVDVDTGPAVAERVLKLERASRIVIDLAGSPEAVGGMCIEASVLEGGDPGWLEERGGRPRIFQCTTPASHDPSRLTLKTRAGSYRMRFIAMAPRTRALSDPRNIVEEMDVDVPEAGEATVRLGPGGQ